ncbi:MAG: hypothetical protein IJD48_00375 [Clostridia bacterium]|nr:hypothetical protein [Clostridia bacterium]
MIKETKTKNLYTCEIDGKIALTIEKVGKNIFHAKNNDMEMTALIENIDEYTRATILKEYKYMDGTQKLRRQYKSWLAYMVEAKGFLTPLKATELKGVEK